MSSFDWKLDQLLEAEKMLDEGKTCDDIAERFGCSEPQARGKMVAIGAYKKKPKATKTANKATKADTVKGIEIMLSLREGQLASFSNATVKDLEAMKDALIKASDRANAKQGL